MSDEQGFASLVGDVTPLAKSNRRQNTNTCQHDPKSLRTKREQAVNPVGNEAVSTHGETLHIGPEQRLHFARSGLDKATMRRLARGQYAIDDTLDLHGHTVERAKQHLRQMLNQAYAKNARCVLIIHGKGGHISGLADPKNLDNRYAPMSIIKSHCAQWLQQFETVLGYCSAKQHDGGTGALYVLLKRKRT